MTKRLSTQTGSTTLDPNQTFPNVTGNARAYKIINVHVPAGADRLDASLAFNTQDFSVFLALVDPFGNYQAYNSPQGTGNFAHVDARNPAPGTWKAMVWANPLFTGKIAYEFTTSRYATYGTVHPSTVTLAPGASATITANFPASHHAGDMSAAVVMKTQRGEDSSMPVSLRTLIPNKPNSSFSGVITGGNGRAQDALSQTFYLNVPKHKHGAHREHRADQEAVPERDLRRVPGRSARHGAEHPHERHRQPAGSTSTSAARYSPTSARPRPAAGGTSSSVTHRRAGQFVNQPFTGKVHYTTPSIQPVSSLPHGKATLVKGKTYKYKVLLKNTNTYAAGLLRRPAVEPRGAVRPGLAGTRQ